nr:unnamed protein product [Digitaria exilis]
MCSRATPAPVAAHADASLGVLPRSSRSVATAARVFSRTARGGRQRRGGRVSARAYGEARQTWPEKTRDRRIPRMSRRGRGRRLAHEIAARRAAAAGSRGLARLLAHLAAAALDCLHAAAEPPGSRSPSRRLVQESPD